MILISYKITIKLSVDTGTILTSPKMFIFSLIFPKSKRDFIALTLKLKSKQSIIYVNLMIIMNSLLLVLIRLLYFFYPFRIITKFINFIFNQHRVVSRAPNVWIKQSVLKYNNNLRKTINYVIINVD